MIQHVLKTAHFIPNEFHHSFFDIDFERLYKEGYRLIITDLDNTLISYEETVPTKQITETFIQLEEMGFTIVLLSNNHPKRLGVFLENMTNKGFANARKPLLKGIKKAFQVGNGIPKEQTILIGDQLMTDIFGANRFGVYNILVNPLKKKTEKWYTKFNRRLEKKMLAKIKRRYPDRFFLLKLEDRK